MTVRQLTDEEMACVKSIEIRGGETRGGDTWSDPFDGIDHDVLRIPLSLRVQKKKYTGHHFESMLEDMKKRKASFEKLKEENLKKEVEYFKIFHDGGFFEYLKNK